MLPLLSGNTEGESFAPTKGLREILMYLKTQGIKIGLVTSGLYNKAYPEIVSIFRDWVGRQRRRGYVIESSWDTGNWYQRRQYY